MSRYIDADKIEYDEIYKGDSTTFEFRKKIVAYKEQVDDIPAADVRENIRGEWIQDKHEMAGYGYFDCSVCGADFYDIEGFNFCPNCGADMRGDNNVQRNDS